MFSGDLKRAQAKLEAEQKQRIEKERIRKEKERLQEERARQREREREEQNRLKRLQQAKQEQRVQELVRDLTEHNRGVYVSAQLQAFPLDEAMVQAKGIKRSSDKVMLPPSMGNDLMNQDAAKNGAMLFEICSASGTRTHAGVLDFTAAEGVVAVPQRVAKCLGPQALQGPVTVTYKRLDKGSFVRFQPLTRGFHEEVGEDIREVLEAGLLTCSTLTEGDIITVSHATKSYELKVQELQPDPQVSVIDTDMEAQVVPSLETEQLLAELEERRRHDEQRLAQLQEEQERQAQEALAQAERLRQEHEQAQQQRQRLRQAKEASLPAEPAPSSSSKEPVATLVFRLPDGTRVQRRFRFTDQLNALFDFVDAKGAGGWEPGTYQLVTQFAPRRQLHPEEAGRRTLQEAGLGAQEAFFLEPVSSS